jgi:transposase
VGHSLLFAVGAWPPHDGVRRARRLNLFRDLFRDLRGIAALRLQTLNEITLPIVPTGTTRIRLGQAETGAPLVMRRLQALRPDGIAMCQGGDRQSHHLEGRRAFRSGRQFAAWLGLVPRQNSSGGKERLGGISKMGDRYLRHLLVVGATAVVRYTRRKATTISIWAKPAAGSQTRPAGHRRGRQQDGPDRLGRHGAGRELSRNPHRCRVRSTATR